MQTYQVQPGDTAHSITHKFLGNASRVHDLLRNNRHKPVVITHGPYGRGGRPGVSRTFQSLQVGEHLVIPPKWSLYACPRGWHRVGNRCVPNGTGGGWGRGVGRGVGQTRMVVEPSAQDGEPILTALGPSMQVPPGSTPVPYPVSAAKKPCCAGCAKTGGSCGKGVGTQPYGAQPTQQPCADSVCGPPCSEPKAPISIPGSTSFPVGFGAPRGLGQQRGLGRGLGQSTTDTSSSLTTAGDVVSAWAVPLTIAVISAAAGFGLAYAITGAK